MIEDLLEHLGVEDIHPIGEEVQARCPKHEERTGELERRPDHWSINRISGAHHCFSCEYSGSLTRLIMDLSGCGLWEAHQLIRQFDVELGDIDEDAWEPPITALIERRLEDFPAPPARAMRRRHLTTESVYRYRLKWDADDNAWVIPIFSPTGDNWGWQTKSPDQIRNYPPGIKKGRTLFGIEVLRTTSWAVLVESPLDVVYLDTLDIPALSAFGCQVSDQQMRLLLDRLDNLVLALDNDKAGTTEMHRLIDQRWHHRLPMTVFNYESTSAKDPGEMVPQDITWAIEHAPLASFW